MRAERLEMSIFAAKKLCGGLKVNRSEPRTTLMCAESNERLKIVTQL